MDVFRKEKFELLTLMETKLKGNGKVSWCGVNGITANVREMERARKCVARYSGTLDVLALEFYGLSLGFQGLKFVWW